jgi:hypothetical protein
MHLALLKALVAVISGSILAVGVALSGPARGAHQPHGPGTASQTASLNADGLQFLGQLAAQLSVGRSLAHIAASRGVSASTPTGVLLRHVRNDLARAERDQAISPVAASAFSRALSTALGMS